MVKKYTMRGEHHIQQFPNAGQYLNNEGDTRVMWWDMPAPALDNEPSPRDRGYASGGSVISQLRRRPGQMMRIHPAMKIPGVHIRTAEAGEPKFIGDE